MTERLLSVRNKLECVLAYSLLLFIPTQFGKHFWPQFSFVLGSRIDYLSSTLYFTDVLIILLLVVRLLTRHRFMIYDVRVKIRKSLMVNRQSILILCVFIFLILNISFSERPTLGWYELLKLLEFIFFGRYMSAFFLKNKELSTIVLAAGVLLESFLGIVQFIHQGSVNGIFYFFGERMFNASTPGIANASINGHLLLRPYATFSHPNALAGYLVVIMTLLLGSSKYKLFSIKYLVYWIAIMLGTCALLLTLSRVAILFWFVLLVFLITKRFVKVIIKKRLFILSIIVTSLLILIISFFLPFVFSRFLGTSLSDESVVLRETLAKDAVLMVASHPLFGVGLHNFLVVLPVVDQHPGTVFTIQPVHNVFLLVAAEIGLPGLLFILWIVFVLYKKLLNDYRYSDENFFIMFLSIAFFEILILGQLDHYWLTIQQGQMVLAVVIGLVLAIKKKEIFLA